MARILAYLRNHARALFAVLVVANLLSLVDLAFTLRVLELGGREVNPLMRYVFDVSPVEAAITKIVLIAAVSSIIWRLRRYRLSLLAALLAVTVYGTVVLYECIAFAHLM
ncbi:MAG: DUF5658 family protein [Thermoleophilia bacterium]